MSWRQITKFPYDPSCGGESIFQAFIDRFGFDVYRRSPFVRDMGKFLRCDKSHNAGRDWRGDDPPRRDHAAAFHKRGTSRRMFAYHPYLSNQGTPDWGTPDWYKLKEKLEVYCNQEVVNEIAAVVRRAGEEAAS